MDFNQVICPEGFQLHNGEKKIYLYTPLLNIIDYKNHHFIINGNENVYNLDKSQANNEVITFRIIKEHNPGSVMININYNMNKYSRIIMREENSWVSIVNSNGLWKIWDFNGDISY